MIQKQGRVFKDVELCVGAILKLSDGDYKVEKITTIDREINIQVSKLEPNQFEIKGNI